MADFLHILLTEPLPGIVIVQIRDAAGIVTAAAELADIMAECRGADQGQVNAHTCLCRQNRCMQRHIMHTDGVGRRVKGTDLTADPHQRQHMGRRDRPAVTAVLLRHAAVLHGLFREGQHIAQRVKLPRMLLQHLFQHRQIQLLLPRQFAPRMLGVGEHIVAEPVTQGGKPRKGIFAALLPIRSTQLPHTAADLFVMAGEPFQCRHTCFIGQQGHSGAHRLPQLLQGAAQFFISVHHMTHFAPRKRELLCRRAQIMIQI